MVKALVNATPVLPLELSGISVRKRGKIILSEISHKFGVSGLTVIMGPNGSGKTTLMRLMHGLEKSITGSINWAVDEQEARKQQAFVFQIPVMMRRSVLENIAYPLRLKGHSKRSALQLAAQSAKKSGLTDVQKLDAQLLSGGERQKLAIARALITNPQVLFLDEPTTNLDGRSTREIENTLRDAQRDGTRIVMTTHDIGQAKRLASDILFLNQGQICEAKRSAEFFDQPQSSAARAYLQGDIVE